MCNPLKNDIIRFLTMLLTVATLSACGSSSSTSTPTTIPNSETLYYVHNLVFRNSTTLLSTGYNGYGQLGTGNLANRTVAGTLDKHYPFSGFATGSNHSVAFFNNSTVRSWGYNSYGQLGNNSTTYSSVPVKTVDISGVIAVASGAHHTLALKDDNTLWSWGSNLQSQLGVGADLVPVSWPKPVKVGDATPGLPFTNISSIAANGYHSVARANGSVWAWGFNGSGQLGRDSKILSASAVPTKVAGLPSSGISYVAAGSAFTYAVVKGDGSVWAWGNNYNGQLGNGTTVSSYTPVQVMKDAVTPLTGVVKAVAGIQHGLALLATGEVWAWGYGIFGQLGNNDVVDSHYAVKVVMNPAGTPLSGATDIKGFGSSSMAKVGGAWYAWGNNSYGQLGIGINGFQKIPVKMSGF